MRPGHDWFYLYYRDRACALALGVTAEEMLLSAVGAAADPASGGRQMPSHWGSKPLNIVSGSSPTGTQFLQAVGCADAGPRLDPESDAVTLVTTGDGATSEGEFWESLNIACLERLPVVYLVEDNGWAISVPVEKQTAGGDISKLVSGFPGLRQFRCDGTNFLDSFATMSEAVDHCRRHRMPVFVHATCIRPYSHSLSDDEKLYKTKADREDEARRDHIVLFPEWMIAEGILDRHAVELITHEADLEVQEATDRALKAAAPTRESALDFLYSDRIDPTSSDFDVEPSFQRRAADDGRHDQPDAAWRRWLATSGLLCSARMSRIRAARKIFRASRARAASSAQPRDCNGSSDPAAFSIPRLRKRRSWGARSEWRRAG